MEEISPALFIENKFGTGRCRQYFVFNFFIYINIYIIDKSYMLSFIKLLGGGGRTVSQWHQLAR